MRKVIKGIITTVVVTLILCCITACNSDAKSCDENNDFHFSVSEEEAAKIPYTLSGENDDWSITIQVREATKEEKDLMVQSIDEDLFVFEENYFVHHTLDQEQFEGLKEKSELGKTDVINNAVYISTMTGQYTGAQEIKTTAKTIFCEVHSETGAIIALGGQDIRSLDAPWYISYNTIKGDYASAMFIPPMEKSTAVVTLDKETVEIPLTLSSD